MRREEGVKSQHFLTFDASQYGPAPSVRMLHVKLKEMNIDDRHVGTLF